jgi:nucleotide-binding universal stress UspA family protein
MASGTGPESARVVDVEVVMAAERIVVGVDTTEASFEALDAAAALARERSAALVVVHVRHIPSATALSESGSEAATMQGTLDQLEAATRRRVAEALTGRGLSWTFEVRTGDPAHELIVTAEERGADAIVVGGRSHGVVGGLIVGSVAQKLVRKSPISVLVVRDGHTHTHPAGAAPAQA